MPGVLACRACGVIATGHGRLPVRLVDTPINGRPVTAVWRKRRGRCLEALCPVNSFTEHDERVAGARALMTARARWWAIGQIRREHASVAGLARQLGCSWSTVWNAVEPILARLAADESRFAGVDRLGVDEHVVRITGRSVPPIRAAGAASSSPGWST